MEGLRLYVVFYIWANRWHSVIFLCRNPSIDLKPHSFLLLLSFFPLSLLAVGTRTRTFLFIFSRSHTRLHTVQDLHSLFRYGKSCLTPLEVLACRFEEPDVLVDHVVRPFLDIVSCDVHGVTDARSSTSLLVIVVYPNRRLLAQSLNRGSRTPFRPKLFSSAHCSSHGRRRSTTR